MDGGLDGSSLLGGRPTAASSSAGGRHEGPHASLGRGIGNFQGEVRQIRFVPAVSTYGVDEQAVQLAAEPVNLNEARFGAYY